MVTKFVGSMLLIAATLSVSAQTPASTETGPSAEVRGTYAKLKTNILKAADKMPEADYQYKPTPEIRTFARIVNHVTEAQFHVCSALNGSKFDATKVPSDTADKATVIAGLKLSFDECDKAYGALSDADMAQMIAVFGPVKRTKIGAAWGNVSHDNEQYAELSTYLRLKGLVPPTAEK